MLRGCPAEILLQAAAFLAASALSAQLEVPVASDGSFKVVVKGEEWFTSGATTFRHDGVESSSEDGSLALVHLSHGTAAGCSVATMHWRAAGGPPFQTAVTACEDHAVFTQSFPGGAVGTSAGDKDKLISAFPALRPAWEGSKGVVSFQGDMTGSDTKTGSWSQTHAGPIGGGIAGSGPVVVFSKSMDTSVVLSAFSNFMAHSQLLLDGTLSYGVMGGVADVPKNYSISTIVSLGRGINEAMDSWGSKLLAHYGKERYAYKADFAMRYLGYSTDNGAYYYYLTEPGKNYQQTLIDVQSYAAAEGIPYQYVLLDSWWYFQGREEGVKLWEARPDIFPDGLQGFFERTKWPQQLHNRMWATDTTYAKQNGGDFTFVCDGSKFCVPRDQRFWDELMANHTKTGMFMYEQDWLDVEFDSVRSLTTDADLARTWMMQMSTGAVRSNVTIQLCMSHVRHILQSVEMPTVTNARASGDYHPGSGQWDIGTTSILAHAVGIAPSKDNYWSVALQPGSKYPHAKEPYSRLHSAALSLSTGPVAPSDAVGMSDPALIRRACNAGGLLLTPDRPATEIDAHFLWQAFGGAEGGAKGHIWTTFVELEAKPGTRTPHVPASPARFSYVLAADVQQDYNLTFQELGYPADSLLCSVEADSTDVRTWRGLLPVKACGLSDFRLITIAPVSSDGFALLGEADKWVSVSGQRFSDLSYGRRGTCGSAAAAGPDAGAPAPEKVEVRWTTPMGLRTSECTVPPGAKADKWVSVSSQRFSDLSYGHGGTCGSVAVAGPTAGAPGPEKVEVRWMTPMGLRTSGCTVPPGAKAYASVSCAGAATCAATPPVEATEAMLV